MKHSEILETITKQTGKTPTQQQLADILETTKNTVGSRAYRDMEYSIDELEKISKAFGVDLLQISWIKSKLDKNEARNCINNEFIDENEIIADYFPDVLASCGNGAFELSQIREKIRVPKMCIEQYMPFARYSVINAYGDSMQPTIQSKDKLVIELLSDSDRIKDNNIYVFFYNDRIFCKRLVQNIDSIMVISDNPDKSIYPTSRIEKENMNEIHLIGRIVGLMRGMV